MSLNNGERYQDADLDIIRTNLRDAIEGVLQGVASGSLECDRVVSIKDHENELVGQVTYNVDHKLLAISSFHNSNGRSTDTYTAENDTVHDQMAEIFCGGHGVIAEFKEKITEAGIILMSGSIG